MEDPTFRAPHCLRKSEVGEYELQVPLVTNSALNGNEWSPVTAAFPSAKKKSPQYLFE